MRVKGVRRAMSELIGWSDEEKQKLQRNNIFVCALSGETIRDQILVRNPLYSAAAGFEVEGRNRLLDHPSRIMEIAVYQDPRKFFVPRSFGHFNEWQELVSGDQKKLRKKLDVNNLNEIIPEAPEITQLVFRLYEASRGRIILFGKDYDYRLVGTNTPTDESGSHIAVVGDWFGIMGLRIYNYDPADKLGRLNIGLARCLVPANAAELAR